MKVSNCKICNLEILSIYGNKKYCDNCLKEKIKEYNRNRPNKEERREKNRIYTNKKDKEKEKLRKQKVYLKYKEKYAKANKEWALNNRDKINASVQRKMKDPVYKITKQLRANIGRAYKSKNVRKNTKTELILRCSFAEFKLYLESKFESWMNWENYGDKNNQLLLQNKSWDIDHIIPLSSAKTEEEIIKLNHYTNLQPLCSYTNRIIKKNKIYEIN